MQSHPVRMANFDDVIDGHEIVLLDFWASWCQPCKILGPLFEELAAQNTDIFFGKVSIEEDKDLAEAFHVKSVPTIMAFKKGQLVFEQAGLPQPAMFVQLVEKLRALEVPPEEEMPAGTEEEPS